MRIVRMGMDYHTTKNTAAELSAANIDPHVAGLAAITGYKLGESKQYLSSILTTEDIDKLDPGSSVAVFCPTGAGKSWIIENIALAISKNKFVIILTNRRACKEQLIHELLKKTGHSSIPHDQLDNDHITEHLIITTYQQYVHICNKYNGKDVVLFLDECHCLAEDATFSPYPQQMVSYLHRNLDKTTRIYITATPEAVLPIIWDLEKTIPSEPSDSSDSSEPSGLLPLSTDNLDYFLRYTPTKDSTRLQMVYLMKADWSYLTFRTFDPDNLETLAAYIKTATEGGKKALIYINDIDMGKKMQELLDDSQHIYSDEDKRMEICEIVANSSFENSALITTKVAENGLSLHDPELTVIVAVTHDLTVLRQIIGRARVNRKNPRDIGVLIPDYTATHLGSIVSKIYVEMHEFDQIKENLDFAMQYSAQPNPYLYYDGILKKPVLNNIGYDGVRGQYGSIQTLRDKETENPHAFVRYALCQYDKDTDNIAELSIHYDKFTECCNRIRDAWETYKSSSKGPEDLTELKTALKSACNDTQAYPKDLKSNIQIDTVNEILRFAGIQEKVNPKREVFDVVPSENRP